jgi:NodT family efflux transporter outer membrane factor (OMF) lipoprotein
MLFGAVLAGLSLSACDFAPPYVPPAMDLPVKFKEGGNFTPAQPQDSEPRGPWWSAFNDRTLDALEPQVDDANQTLAAALANYEQARTTVQQAEAGLYPSVDQYTQFTTNRQSDHRTYRSQPSAEPNHYGNNELELQASYEVDLWGRVRDTIKASAAEAQAQAALLESVRLSLHADLARDYIALRGIDREVKLLRDTQKAFEDALTLTENRLAGKIASPMDVERAKSQLESAKALIDEDFARRALLEHAIATLVGQPASGFSIPAAPVAVASPRGPAAAPSTLLERRPDIAQAEREVAAANEQIGVAKAAFYPRFMIDLSGGTEDRGIHLFDLANGLYTVGPAITLPIFDGGRRTAQLEASIARRDQTIAQYKATVLKAVQEVEDALSSDRYLSLENKRIEAAVKSEKKVLDLSLTLYRDGATTYLDVVTAQTTLLGEQRTSLALLTRRLGTSVNLFVALGGGWTPAVHLASGGPT